MVRLPDEEGSPCLAGDPDLVLHETLFEFRVQRHKQQRLFFRPVSLYQRQELTELEIESLLLN